ncbi:MAG: response regulator [Bacteroidia bacterium]
MDAHQKFILIDDDPNQNILNKIIIRKSFGRSTDVISFSDAEEGVQFIETEYALHPTPAVLFLDINMPTLTGWEVLKKLHRVMVEVIRSSLRIYIISSSIDPRDRQRADDDPIVTGYIEKPITMETLLSYYIH